MKAKLLLPVVLLAVLFVAGCVGGQTQTTSQSQSLEDVYTGFKEPQPGDWVEWKTGVQTIKYIYVGETTMDGKNVYGFEFHQTLNGKTNVVQVWFDESTGKVVRYVMKSPAGVLCLDSSTYSSSGTTPSKETPEEYKPENIEKVGYSIGTYTTKSGKTIKVVKIKQPGMEVWVSSEVPFGIVKTIIGGKTQTELIDFGSGAEPEISIDEAKNCKKIGV